MKNEGYACASGFSLFTFPCSLSEPSDHPSRGPPLGGHPSPHATSPAGQFHEGPAAPTTAYGAGLKFPIGNVFGRSFV